MDLDLGTGTRNVDKSPNAMSRPAGNRQATFAQLLLLIQPQLDKDKAMQLQGLYVQLTSQNINKGEFVRHMRSLAGDDMLKMAVNKLYQQGLITVDPRMYNKSQKRRLLEHESESHGVQANHESSNVDAIKQERDEQQNYDLQMRQGLVHTAFSDVKRLHGRGVARFTIKSGQLSMHKYQSLMSLTAYGKQETLDQINDQQHKFLLSAPRGPSSISPGQIESSKDGTFEMMSSKPGFSNSMTEPEPMSITAQLERLNVSAGNSSLVSGYNAKSSPKKPTVGQEIKLEAPVSLLRKKQKVSGAFSDQQLNDVTAFSGVHLREEKKQLFSGSKEDSRVSEANGKINQALQKKLDEIMAKRGVRKRSNDVDRCLSLVQDVQAELEKEREARLNLEKRLEKMERDREQERVEQVEREKKIQKQFDEVMKKSQKLANK